MDTSIVSRLKQLQDENRRLKKMYAEAQMNADILKEAHTKTVRPSLRREVAGWVVTTKGACIRQACADFTVSQTCYRYQPKLSYDNAVIAD